MDAQTTTDQIKKFLARQFPATKKIGVEDPLLKSGLIDSLGILDVVAFLEKEFSITITDEELVPENFESIRTLGQFVERKINGG